MDGADRPHGCQQHDEPFDLPPMAKVDRVPQIAAALGARCRLKTGIVAKLCHQIGGIIKCCATMDIGGLGRGIIGRIVKRK